MRCARMSNKEWIDFLSEAFDVSRTTARDMLHSLCILKRYDNLKRPFNAHYKERKCEDE